MSSSPDQAVSCSCCPYPGSFSHTRHEAGSLPAGAEDSGEYQLFDSESHQNTSSDRATVVNSWDPARTNAPLDAAGAVPEENFRGQALAHGAFSFYPGEHPRKRNRHEFEAGAPANPCPGAGSHPTTCMEAFKSALAPVIQKHMGTSDVELNCIVRGSRLGDGSAEHRVQMKFRC